MAALTTGEVQNNAINKAADISADFNEFIVGLKTLAQNQFDSTITWSVPSIISPIDFLAASFIPEPSSPTVAVGTTIVPTVPELSDVAIPSVSAMPEFVLAEPVINFPVAPSSALPSAPDATPDFNAPLMPARPEIVWPELPVWEQVTLPEAPTVLVPVFTERLPDDTIADLTTEFNFSENVYSSELLSLITQLIETDLRDGGYGINPGDEEALWERARERELAAADAAIAEALRVNATQGFSIPSGAALTFAQAAEIELLSKSSTLSRDVMLRRSELYVQARQFAIQAGTTVENILITYFAGFAERALNAARYAVDSAISIYNAKLARYNLQLERYKAAASVHESLVRAALAHLEMYKTQVEAARVETEVTRSYVEIYATQVNAVQALVNVYRTDMEAARTAAEIERLRLEAYKTRVEAYATQVQAKSAEFQMFKTQIEGENSKVDLYRSQVDAYNSRVTAYRAEVEAADVRLKGAIAVQQNQLSLYDSRIKQFASDLERNVKQSELEMARYSDRVRSYGIKVERQIAAGRGQVDVAKANADIALANAQTLVSAHRVQTDSLARFTQLNLEATAIGARELNALARTYAEMTQALTAEVTTV